ncbi:MAG: DUF4203 domain-containing protein [Verrucomicrobiae bacterium]|nr:DUF4203 domain-containing protein [Verrucomicrobiae bacterium]
MNWMTLLLGTLALFFGRRLFWLFVAAVGFIVGVKYAPQILVGQPEWVILLAALGLGLIGAFLAVLLERLAFAIAGFFAAGHLAVLLVHRLGQSPGDAAWIFFLIGGVIGAALMAIFVDWAIIAISAVFGAGVIVHELPLHGNAEPILFIALAIVGILAQAGMLHAHRRRQVVVVEETA